MRKSLYTIPSGPGDSLLLRVLMHSLKALLFGIEECSQFHFFLLLQLGLCLIVV